MLSWIETKYINMLSPRLDRFAKRSNAYNFRCPYCGDSKKSKTKARGWVFNRGKETRYYCHNCGASKKFKWFLKDTDSNLYYEYIKETLLEKGKEKSDLQEFVDKMKKPEHVKKTNLKALKKVSQLRPDHKAKQYIMKRYIPPKTHHNIYYAPKFREWTNTMLDGKFEDLEYDDARIVLPLLDPDGKMFGFQGRALDKNDMLKYITILLDQDMPKMYGLDSFDPKQKIPVFEGPIDSMFIKNSMASCGGDITTEIKHVSKKYDIDIDQFIAVYDNEPRSKETIKKMAKAIEEGINVMFWPKEIQSKDVNDMITKESITAPDIERMLGIKPKKGLAGQLNLIDWSKIPIRNPNNLIINADTI